MIDIVSIYGKLAVLSFSEQQAELSKLKKIDMKQACELEEMLKVDDITLSNSEFITQNIYTTVPITWQSFIGENVMGFTIKSLLSDTGGMGIVFHAEQSISSPTNTHNEIHKAAIKVLRSDKLNNSQQKAMFFSEASSLMSLDHPNICSIYGVSTVLDHACIVMDYIDGQSLDTWLALNQPDNKEKINLFINLLNAVGYLHNLQIYHGDLKPHNIIINDQGHLVLIDLGLSKKFEQFDENDNNKEQVLVSEEIKGYSKNWSAPEQISGHPCKAMSDVYSLGAILFYLLTGDSPTKQETLKITDIELAAVVKKSLAYSAENRYQDANEFRLAVINHQQGFPLDEYTTNPFYQFKKLIQRKPFTSLACLLMVYSIAISVMLFIK
ncbi:MAG: serine/threonine-protein kinase [Cognaticolwellia sp.]